MKYKDVSKFPGIYKDVAFIVDNKVTSQDIELAIKKSGGRLLTNIQIFHFRQHGIHLLYIIVVFLSAKVKKNYHK